MSKNLTRKGLVIGAVVALGTSLFAGAPAQAASVLFAPTTGTGNTVVAGGTFSLTASLSADLPASNASQLKFKVVNTTGVKVPAITVGGQSTAGGSYAVNYATSGSTDALDASTDNWTATAPAAGDAKVFGVGNGSGVSAATNPTAIVITSTKDTTDSFAVTAFLDANNNGVLDAGELSAVQTVNFVKVANAGATVAFTTPNTSAGALSATVSFGADINVAQLDATKYKLAFGKYLTTGEAQALSTAVSTDVIDALHGLVALQKNSDNTGLKLASAYTTTISALTYGAQLWSSATNGSTFAAIGTEVLAAAGASQSTAVTTLGAAVTDNSTATTVRSGTVSASFTQTIKNVTSSTDSTLIAVGAGVPVTYTISSSSAVVLGTDAAGVADTISVNGVALTSATVYPVTGTVLTDASGKINIPVVTRAGVAGTHVTVSTVPTNSGLSATSATLTWTDATTVAPIDLSVGANVHTVVKGGTFTASYALTDSYHALVKGSAYRIRFTEPGAAGSTTPTSNTVYVPFVDGIANVSVADNSTGAGTNAATITVEKNVNGLWVSGSALTAASANDSALAATVNAPFTVLAAAQVATTVTVPAAAYGSIDTADTFATVNQETAYNTTVPTLDVSSNAAIKKTISGVVTDANGVGVNGAQVTIASPGVQFVANSAAPFVYSVGSITVTADALGNYSVDVYSHVAGATKFVVTSGAATKTATITYTAVSGYTTASAMTVAGPTTSQASRATAFTATVVDKLGNVVSGVALKATLTGVGSFAGSTNADGSISVTTSSAGVATVTVLFGANDLGDTVVTFSDATGQDTPIASVAKTVSVGATDAQVDIVGNRVTAVASFTKGKIVAFYVDGIKKWSKASATDADVVINSNLKKGTHTVTVKISGGFVTTEKFIVK